MTSDRIHVGGKIWREAANILPRVPNWSGTALQFGVDQVRPFVDRFFQQLSRAQLQMPSIFQIFIMLVCKSKDLNTLYFGNRVLFVCLCHGVKFKSFSGGYKFKAREDFTERRKPQHQQVMCQTIS